MCVWGNNKVPGKGTHRAEAAGTLRGGVRGMCQEEGSTVPDASGMKRKVETGAEHWEQKMEVSGKV